MAARAGPPQALGWMPKRRLGARTALAQAFAAMAPLPKSSVGQFVDDRHTLEALAPPRPSETLAPLRRPSGGPFSAASQKGLHVAMPTHVCHTNPVLRSCLPPLTCATCLSFTSPSARPGPHAALVWPFPFPKQRITYHTVP